MSHYQTFSVPFVGYGGRSPGDVDHVKNEACLVARYHDAVKSLMRCQADSYRLRSDHVQNDLQTLSQRAFDYAAWSGLVSPRLDWQNDADMVIARADRLRASPEYKARMTVRAELAEATKKREAEYRAKRAVEYAVRVQEWRAGASVTLPLDVQTDVNDGAMLRIVGDTVQTSLGAEVPLDHAARVYQWYKEAPRPWTATPA